MTLPLMFLFSGCYVIDAYFMAPFDNNEYALTNKIRTSTTLTIKECKNDKIVRIRLDDINDMALELKNYTQYIPDNEDSYELSTKLYNMTGDTVEYYTKKDKVSKVFCEMKLKQILQSTEKIQETFGRKYR